MDNSIDTYFNQALVEQPDMDLRDELFSLFSKKEELENQKRVMDLVIVGLEKEIKKIEEDKKLLEEVWVALRTLLDNFSAESIGVLAEMLNKGVKAIFYDRDYEIKIDISDTKSKKMKLKLVEYKIDGSINEVDLYGRISLIGGGVLTVISFILQVYLIVHHGKRRVVFADEAFTNISQKYVENFFSFLKYLHSDMGFSFMLVNHDVRFMSYFDKVYEVNMGDVKLKQG